MSSILIVEDDASIRVFLATALRRWGYAARTVASAAAAEAALRQEPCCGLMLDLQLADESGYVLALRLRQSGLGLPIVLISGHADQPFGPLMKALDVAAFLPKPFELAALERTVAAAFGAPAPARPA
ncbi:MAG TPA: response regulator [Herpetosiphonaceae bacterium]